MWQILKEIILFEFFVVLVCLVLNAVLSCIEMAFVTVSKPHLRKMATEGNRLAKLSLELKLNPERVLSVLQIGITLVGAVSAAVGGAAADEVISPYLVQAMNISSKTADSLSIILVVLPITFFSVVIGELVPKALALRFPIKFTILGSPILKILDKLFAPFVFILETCTKLIITVFVNNLKSEPMTSADGSVDLETLTDSHKQYVLNLLSVDKRRTKDIMLPWDAVTKIDKNLHYQDVLEVIRNSRHTRIPVVDSDRPFGILHSKEFISEIEIAKMNWNELVRPLIYLNFDEPILTALKLLQSKKSHMALIKKRDEILGIVTMEDIFEEIVGEIYDEDDNPEVLLSTNSRIRQMNLKP